MKIDEGARRIWLELVELANSQGDDITYTQLAGRIGSKTPILGRQLGLILRYCEEEQLPPLTVLVVGKSSRVAGRGFYDWDRDGIAEGRESVLNHRWRGPNPFEYARDGSSIAALSDIVASEPSRSTEVYTRVKSRGIAQQIFREAIWKIYDECAICGNTHRTCLQAAHIVPYAEANDEMRINPGNGLLLCANHHLMFDRDEIAVREDGVIVCQPGKNDAIRALHGQRAKIRALNTPIGPSPDCLKRRFDKFQQALHKLSATHAAASRFLST